MTDQRKAEIIAAARAAGPDLFISARALDSDDLHGHVDFSPESVAAEGAHVAAGGLPQSALSFHAHPYLPGHQYEPWHKVAEGTP